MSWLRKLFSSAKTRAPQEHARNEPDSCSGGFTEKDNIGTRHETFEHAFAYWSDRMVKQKKDPFVLYTFDSESQAREALLDLPCIHVANDSRKLICTEVLIFGHYATK